MSLRQEQIVFVVALVLLGFMSWRLFGDEAGSRRSSRGSQEEVVFEDHLAPDVAVALPNEVTPRFARELFAPPRDTRPLPPLDLVEPPRLPFVGLLPPGDPGPAPGAYGQLLRVELEEADLPGLFDVAEVGFDPDDEFFAGDPDQEVTPEARDRLKALGYLDDEEDSGIGGRRDDELDPFADETPAEREARFAGYRGRYDWIQRGPGDVIFGRIQNEERYGLAVDPARANEPLEFVQLDPETGKEWFANIGAPPIQVDRATIEGFDFAATVANEIEVRRREIGDALTRATYDEALQLAGYCIRNRHEAPRALEIAEELYRMAAAYDAEDPAPRLGLARVHEAGFRFEEAFREYQSLLETFPHRAEVHARLALLEERFLLHREAEARLKQALRVHGGSWEARWAMGGFLLRRGRAAEAVEHLREANKVAPSDPALRDARVGIRVDLADALFALGEVEEAARVYGQALGADSDHQRARAGAISAARLSEAAVPVEAGAGADEGEGFDLQLARGLAAMHDGRHETARELLDSATEADPLRAAVALGSLSYLAELTGNTSQAAAFADEALASDPTDAYALYQRGRLLGGQDDYEGARESLLGALEVDLDFEDALVSLGEMAFRLGRFDDAERYLQRALEIDGSRPEVHALRGVNFLRLGSVPEARAAFDEALALAPTDPTSRAGVAWCTYLDGDVEQALVHLRNLDDSRRDLPEDDPWRAWSTAQIERIQDHVQKVEWRDGFDRKRLINGWLTREDAGPQVTMVDGTVQLEGSFTREGTAQVYREYSAGSFVSFEADLWIDPSTTAHVGIFAARERQQRGERNVQAEASVLRHGTEGGVQVRFVKQGQPVDVTDMEQVLPTGQWVRLGLSRSGEASQTVITLSVDGIPLVEDVPLPTLGTANSPLLIGLFAEGQSGSTAKVRMNDASVVYRLGF